MLRTHLLIVLHLSKNVCGITQLCMCFKFRSGNGGFEYCRSTPYSVYSPETYDGHWRQLTVRTSQNNHIMAIAYFNPQVLSRLFTVRDSLH